jgi:hypothetical protein
VIFSRIIKAVENDYKQKKTAVNHAYTKLERI